MLSIIARRYTSSGTCTGTCTGTRTAGISRVIRTCSTCTRIGNETEETFFCQQRRSRFISSLSKTITVTAKAKEKAVTTTHNRKFSFTNSSNFVLSSLFLPRFYHHRSFSSTGSDPGSDPDNSSSTNNKATERGVGGEEAGVGPVTNKLSELISEGSIQPDPLQLHNAKELDRVYHDLLVWSTNNDTINTDQSSSSSSSSPFSFFSQFFDDGTDGGDNNFNNYVKGIYTYGGVGCGKTFLMELFFKALDDDEYWSKNKQIIHYHKFMLNVHQFIHNARKERRSNEKKDDDGKENLIDPVVDHILSNGKLLCLDEFQVTDVADAMILKQLFGKLWSKGCVLITTSNRPPKDLYLHGLQRERFLPFIDALEEHCATVSLMADDATDYRMVISGRDDDDGCDDKDDEDEDDTAANTDDDDNNIKKNKTKKKRAKQAYFCGKDQKKTIRKLFYERAKGRPSNPTTLSTQGRKVKIPMACKSKSICMFSFEELCQKALGAADYLVIGQNFSTVFVYNIHQLTIHEINSLRRFITFVDSMYELKVRLLLQTNAPSVNEIFTCDDKESYRQDEVFAFDRTLSRLFEMSSTQYLSSQWLGTGSYDDDTTILDLEPSLSDQWYQLVVKSDDDISNIIDDDKDERNDHDDLMIKEFEKLFDRFDLNKDGVLDKSEIKSMMSEAFGYEPVDVVVEEMISSIDTDNNGVIDSNEFCIMLAEIKKYQQRTKQKANI